MGESVKGTPTNKTGISFNCKGAHNQAICERRGTCALVPQARTSVLSVGVYLKMIVQQIPGPEGGCQFAHFKNFS